MKTNVFPVILQFKGKQQRGKTLRPCCWFKGNLFSPLVQLKYVKSGKATANSHRCNAASQPEETPNQQEWSSTSAGRRAGAGVPAMSVETQYVTDKILRFISPPLWWFLFVLLPVRSALEQSGFGGWPQETGCGVGNREASDEAD